MEDQKLKDFFEFDEFDLQANRMGQFTEKQKARLAKDNKYGNVVGLIIGGILTLIGLGSGYFAINSLKAYGWVSRILGFGIFFIVAIVLCGSDWSW